jgi:hypothetical protein
VIAPVLGLTTTSVEYVDVFSVKLTVPVPLVTVMELPL